MGKITVICEKLDDGGYSAYLPLLPGCIATAESLSEIKNSIKETITYHIEGMQEENLTIPESFQREYELTYKMDIPSLFGWFSGVLTKRGISRITGMNQSLISQYAMGIKRPSSKQTKKIESALHSLGKELMEIEL